MVEYEFKDKGDEERYKRLRKKINRAQAVIAFFSLFGIFELLSAGIIAAAGVILMAIAPIVAVNDWKTELMELIHSDGVRVKFE